MRLRMVSIGGEPVGTVVTARGLAPLPEVDPTVPRTVHELLRHGLTPALREHLAAEANGLSEDALLDPASLTTLAPVHPALTVGIGLNYREHAADLSAAVLDEPATFVKSPQTLVGPEEHLVLPPQSERVTAEAEVGLVFGQDAWAVEDWTQAVVGVCTVLDQTAEDILMRDARHLTRSKNFRTFLSLGPDLTTLDEVLGPDGTLDHLRVTTVRNGEALRSNTVAHMTFGPEFLVRFLTRIWRFSPGDVISTGTPGAVPVEDGDVVECHVEGLAPLRNPVRRPAPDQYFTEASA